MKKLDNSGSTMVTVIVAFVLLVMGFAMFTTVLQAASDSVASAENTRRAVDHAMEVYYTDQEMTDETAMTGEIQIRVDDNTGFKLFGKGYRATEKAENASEGFTLYYFK